MLDIYKFGFIFRFILSIFLLSSALHACKSGVIRSRPVDDTNLIIWVIDDGEKVIRDAINLPFKNGTNNPIWSPGQPIKLFSLRNETVAFQIIIENLNTGTLKGVTVDLERLIGPGGAELKNAEGANDPTNYVGRYIERFVENYFYLEKHSGIEGEDGYKNSQGWNWGAGPAKDEWIGWMPDALIPVEAAPEGAPYPLRIPAQNNGAVWIDITVPKGQTPGAYHGEVVIAVNENRVASIEVELQIHNATLADRPVNTMVCYDEAYPTTFERCFGDQKDPAIRHLWKLYRRHRLNPMIHAHSLEETEALLPLLDGSFYSPENGYDGPGVGLHEGILALGRYGSFEPSAQNLARLEQLSKKLIEENLMSITDVFIYALDEDCSDSTGVVRAWRELLDGSDDPNIKPVYLGWTCSQPVAEQKFGADLAIKQISTFIPEEHVDGKTIWAYNGTQPHSGAFLTDVDAIAIRVNGWLSGIYNINRWFYWSSTAWYDQFSQRTFDPYVDPRTFIIPGKETDMGDGMLIYPGRQIDKSDTKFDLNMVGVVASIRLKNWRRGIQDAGYYQMALAANPGQAEKIVTDLKLYPGCVMGYITEEGETPCKLYHPPVWSSQGKVFFDARKQLLALIPDGSIGVNAESGRK